MANNTNSIVFGTGKLISIPTKENPTPVVFGDLIDLMVDINQPLKTLISDKQFPIAVARGAATINLKAKTAVFNGKVLRDLLFGVQKSAGKRTLTTEQLTVPAVGPFVITVASMNFVEDLGVFDSLGTQFTRVATLTGAGQYTVSMTGVYTFHADDAGKMLSITYAFTDANGSNITVKNELMGFQPSFAIVIELPDQTVPGKTVQFKFNRVVAAKFSFQLVNEDFARPDFEMQAFADENGEVFSISTSEV